MSVVDVDDFGRETECIYRDERYSVRDNGAVLRHHREGKRRRALDGRWTFGKENRSNAYLHVAGVRVHRIVATAFHGEPPDPNYVVDHIDSNCRNNRPDNLRWLTRLENALKNPVTRKKIEYLCGSIEAFLENPSILNERRAGPRFAWMRAVTPEEAQNCLRRMSVWANAPQKSRKSGSLVDFGRSFEKRVYKPLQKWEADLAGEPGLDFAKTPWCAQYMWHGDAHFPCCPNELGRDPIAAYFENLRVGSVCARPDRASVQRFPELTVARSRLVDAESSIVVMCSRADSAWSLVGIWLNEKLHFIHFKLGSFRNAGDADRALSSEWSTSDFWRVGYGSTWEPK